MPSALFFHFDSIHASLEIANNTYFHFIFMTVFCEFPKTPFDLTLKYY